MVGLKFNENKYQQFCRTEEKESHFCVILFTTGHEEGNKQKVESCPGNQIRTKVVKPNHGSNG